MQLIIYLPLIAVAFPSNALALFQIMIPIITFDIIPTESILSRAIEFDDDKQNDYLYMIEN